MTSLPNISLPDPLRRITEPAYPCFSHQEMERRRTAIKGALAETGCDHLVFCGANRFGSAVQWLTGWPVTAEAVGVFTPGRPDSLFVQYHNHLPLARRLAGQADVHWGGQSSVRKAATELDRRGAQAGKVATVGPLSAEQHEVLAARFGPIKNLNKSYVRLRMIKSAEELDWLRIGAHFSDLGMAALRDGLRAGLTERELGDLVERAYLGHGGTHVIHYFGVTPMRDPQVAVPAQFPSTRRVQQGDVVFAEISAAFWDYPGQVLRSFAVGEVPTPLYRDLHAAADAAFDAIAAVLRDGALPVAVIEAARVIEDAGFTTIDDLLHGYGGGYLPPILGSMSRPAGPVPDAPFRAGMTVVIQPNVTTLDGKAGVQTGEIVLVTQDGVERMHSMPRGFLSVTPL
jgi:Xaa-Pro aminopeptidase